MDRLPPGHAVPVTIHRLSNVVECFTAITTRETKMEVAVLARGDIISLVLQTLLKKPREKIIE
jgi:hypothetical protein